LAILASLAKNLQIPQKVGNLQDAQSNRQYTGTTFSQANLAASSTSHGSLDNH
jgi:hypothetical protein